MAVTALIIAALIFIMVVCWAVFIIWLARVLIARGKSKEVRQEKNDTKQTLGAVLKAHRERCKMTQEFVAESVGVSRQAVSKWETGRADPSTSNLLALAKLYGASAEEILSSLG